MLELVSGQPQFKTPGQQPEEVKVTQPIQQMHIDPVHQVMKNKSLVQPQSELDGFIRKLPLKTANLVGDETSFEWPNSKKQLMDILVKNQQTEVRLERIFPVVVKIEDTTVLQGIKLAFSGVEAGLVTLEPPENDQDSAEGKQKKAVKMPDGHKGLYIVFVQNQDSFKAVYFFDYYSLHSWKRSQDLTKDWPKVHEYKISPDETLVGFYGRFGQNCIKSLGPIVYKNKLAENSSIIQANDKQAFNFKSKRDGLKSIASSEMQGSTTSSSRDGKSEKERPHTKKDAKKAKKGQPACGQVQWQSFLKDLEHKKSTSQDEEK